MKLGWADCQTCCWGTALRVTQRQPQHRGPGRPAPLAESHGRGAGLRLARFQMQATTLKVGAKGFLHAVPRAALSAFGTNAQPLLSLFIAQLSIQKLSKSFEAVQCTVDFFLYSSKHLALRSMSCVGSVDVKVMQCNAMQCNAMQCNAMQCNVM